MEQSISAAASRFQHRDLSILVGILSGTLLIVFASENPLSNFQPIDLVIFLAVPALAGAIAGLTSAGRSMENGAVVGVVIGLVYAILNGLRLDTSAAGEQVLFLILTIPIWGFLGAYGSLLAHRTLEAPQSRILSSHGPTTLHEQDPCKAQDPLSRLTVLVEVPKRLEADGCREPGDDSGHDTCHGKRDISALTSIRMKTLATPRCRITEDHLSCKA